MSWGRMFLPMDWGQQLDIEDIESDVARLRARLHSQASVDRTHEEALLTLRREITDLQLVVAELARMLVAGGTLQAEAVQRIMQGVDRSSPTAR